MTGKRRDHLIGRAICEVFPEAIDREFYHLCHRAMETLEPDRDRRPTYFRPDY
jgi:hypothetical protein